MSAFKLWFLNLQYIRVRLEFQLSFGFYNLKNHFLRYFAYLIFLFGCPLQPILEGKEILHKRRVINKLDLTDYANFANVYLYFHSPYAGLLL